MTIHIIKKLIDQMKELTDGERKEVFAAMIKTFCLSCGVIHNVNAPCNCPKEENNH